MPMLYVQVRFYIADAILRYIIKPMPSNKVTATLKLKFVIWNIDVIAKTLDWKIKNSHRR